MVITNEFFLLKVENVVMTFENFVTWVQNYGPQIINFISKKEFFIILNYSFIFVDLKISFCSYIESEDVNK